MKTSPVAIALWTVNAAIVVGGGWFVVKNVKEFREERANAFLTATRDFKPKPVERWEDLKARADLKIEFDRLIALTPGNPGFVPDDPKPPGPSGTNPNPPPPQVNIAPIIDAMAQQVSKLFTVQMPVLAGKSPSVQVDISFKPGIDFDAMSFFAAGFDVHAHLEGTLAGGKQPYDRCVVHAVTPEKVVLKVSNPALRNELTKAKTAQGGKKMVEDLIKAGKLFDEDTFALVPIGGPLEQGLTLEEILAQLNGTGGSSGAPAPGAKPGPGTAKEPTPAEEAAKLGMPNPADIKPVEKPVDIQNIPNESKQNEDGSWDLGLDVLNQDTFKALADYAETYIDSSGNQAGLKVGSSLPEDNSNAAYRMGARRGDVIKKINGQPVRNMAETQAVVSRLRDQGVTRFEVEGERNGVPMTKVFNAPKKQTAATQPAAPAGTAPGR